MSGHTPSEPVAWRYRYENEGGKWTAWRFIKTKPDQFLDVQIDPLYSHAANEAKIEALKDALEHVTELLVDTWNDAMEGDAEENFAVLQARTALQAATGGENG